MWLRRSKTRARVHNAPSPKFACSSFKDVTNLFSDADLTAAAAAGDSPDSPSTASICHRNRSASARALLRSLSHPSPPQTPAAVVIYFTSLRVVRRTFEDCKSTRAILRALRVAIDERDLSMDAAFVGELQRILAPNEKTRMTLPRVFIGGRYVGGAEEVRRLHESGEIKAYVEGLPKADPATCGTCGGHGFVLCDDCSGSHKRYSEKGGGGGFRSCTVCNENGLIRCPSCSTAPL